MCTLHILLHLSFESDLLQLEKCRVWKLEADIPGQSTWSNILVWVLDFLDASQTQSTVLYESRRVETRLSKQENPKKPDNQHWQAATGLYK